MVFKLWTAIILYSAFYIESAPLLEHMVDLTHAFNNETLHSPGVKKFQVQFMDAFTDGKVWYQIEEYSSSTHVGTHMDSPCHFTRGRWKIDEIPLSRLIVPIAVVDIRGKVKDNRDYEVTIGDLEEWELQTGKALNDVVLMIRSGWSKYWGDRKSFTGTSSYNSTEMHYPGLSPVAAQWLVDYRNIYGVGTEALSPDYGPSKDFKVHLILSARNIFNLENVANFDQLPSYGATLHIMPMKIEDACGAPVRLIATFTDNFIASKA